ncbi:MAG: hypothetical protein GX786_04970 [Clostridiales bacterium]|nr:hypothetical protein [Clostridiales bacterium]
MRRQADHLLWQIEKMEAFAQRTTAPIDKKEGRGKGGYSDVVGNGATAIADIKREYGKPIQVYLEHVAQVIKAFEKLDDPDQYRIMNMRYIEGLLWEEIMEQIPASRNWCFERHRKALKKLGIKSRY